MSGEPDDVDEVAVLLKAKALHNGDDLSTLSRLNCLRLQYSRAQINRPVELKVFPPSESLGVSRSRRGLYFVLIVSLLASIQCRWLSILCCPYWHQQLCILSGARLYIRCPIDGNVPD